MSSSKSVSIQAQGENRGMIQEERTESRRDNQRLTGLPTGSRQELYRFLAYLFTQNPDRDFIDRLRSDEEIAQLQRFEDAIGEDSSMEELRGSLRRMISMLRSWRDEDQKRLTKLQEDHARLLRGISRHYGPPPPYESVYRSNVVMSDHASDVLTLYHRAGLDVRGSEPPDHIGLELAFMAYLCEKEDEHGSEGDRKKAIEFISFQREFLSGHIMKWIPQFCRNVPNHDSAFYTAVAELTTSWLRLEEKFTEEPKPG